MQFPRINGFVYDFSSIEITLNNKIYVAVISISYEDAVEEGERRGAAGEVLGRTRGQLQMGTGSIEIDKEEGAEFLDALGDGYLEKIWNASMVYGAQGARTTTDKLFGCRFLRVADDHGQGTDALNMSKDFSFLRSTRNGKTRFINERK